MQFKSLRSQLLFWLLMPLLLVALLDVWVTHREAQETATKLQNRLLLGAARMIGQQISVEDEVLQVTIPPAALELFASPSRDRVFYRVSHQNGLLVSGYEALPMPLQIPESEQAVFFDAMYEGAAVHIVAFSQPIFVLTNHEPLVIEVAQTMGEYKALVNEIWMTSIRRQLALLGLVAVLLFVGMRRAIGPLDLLREHMLKRTPGALDRLDDREVPSELQPVVAALNDYVERLNRHLSAQGRFIADASHQLRTPLTLLNTQVVYAIRHEEPQVRQEALHAILQTVQHGMRLVKQLLTYSGAEVGVGAEITLSSVDMMSTVQSVLEAFASFAQKRHIDLGMVAEANEAHVLSSPQLLYELIANLVDNALRYTHEGGVVTVHVKVMQTQVVLSVEDNGPGIAEEERERVFERFYRINNIDSDGCGLGLPIVQEIAKRSRASVVLTSSQVGKGLLVQVIFPKPALV